MMRILACTVGVVCVSTCAPAVAQPVAQEQPAPSVDETSPIPAVERPGRSHDLPDGVTLTFEHNGIITRRSLAFHAEVPWTPRLQELRAAEGLDDVIGEGDEWTRMQRLARWVYGQWAPSKPQRIPPWDAIDVLASIRAGGTGNCAQYAIVQVQSALSLGWQARYLSLGTDHPGNQHTSVEVWSNTFEKWVVLDTHFGLFVEDEAMPGVPLSAREIHAALVGGRRDELLVQSIGGDQQAHPRPGVDFLGYFFHLAADQRNDHLSGAPLGWTRKETYLAWRDEHTDGRPALFSELTESAADFDPPMNQIEVAFLTPMPVRRKPGLVLCAARTNMSAMASILVTLGDEPPRHVPLRPESGSSMVDPAEEHALQEGAALTRTLDKQFGQLLLWSWQLTPGSNLVSFQGVNAMGVAGPAAVFELEFEP